MGQHNDTEFRPLNSGLGQLPTMGLARQLTLRQHLRIHRASYPVETHGRTAMTQEGLRCELLRQQAPTVTRVSPIPPTGLHSVVHPVTHEGVRTLRTERGVSCRHSIPLTLPQDRQFRSSPRLHVEVLQECPAVSTP